MVSRRLDMYIHAYFFASSRRCLSVHGGERGRKLQIFLSDMFWRAHGVRIIVNMEDFRFLIILMLLLRGPICDVQIPTLSFFRR